MPTSHLSLSLQQNSFTMLAKRESQNKSSSETNPQQQCLAGKEKGASKSKSEKDRERHRERRRDRMGARESGLSRAERERSEAALMNALNKTSNNFLFPKRVKQINDGEEKRI